MSGYEFVERVYLDLFSGGTFGCVKEAVKEEKTNKWKIYTHCQYLSGDDTVETVDKDPRPELFDHMLNELASEPLCTNGLIKGGVYPDEDLIFW